jgi:TM2 domain-containing membrane protein YozV
VYCRNCGKEVQQQATACLSCGLHPRAGTSFCWQCAEPTHPQAVICVKCGVSQGGGAFGGVFNTTAGGENRKLIAALLGIFLGSLGIHRFYLGYTVIGVIQLVLGVAGLLTCGITTVISMIWGLVEGIMILAGAGITKDAKGVPLT